jgi:hypothetical protein
MVTTIDTEFFMSLDELGKRIYTYRHHNPASGDWNSVCKYYGKYLLLLLLRQRNWWALSYYTQFVDQVDHQYMVKHWLVYYHIHPNFIQLIE